MDDIPPDSGQAPKDQRPEPSRIRRAPRALAKSTPWGFGRYVLARFGHDLCQQRAAQLTFTALLALVPLLAVSFAIFAAFPAYSRLKTEVQGYIFNNFVPQVGESLQGHLDSFTEQTGELTAVGILFLVFTSVMLLVTVSNTMNVIWRAPRRKNFIAQMLVFWAMITLAPLLFGASLSLSSYLFTLARLSEVEGYTGGLISVTAIAPFILQTFGFAALFLIMPNARVQKTDAMIGGLFASALFEGLKKGFGLYITSFPTYQTIYGALATIPIFLVWVYLSWIVVLLSAEVTAALPEWRAGTRVWRGVRVRPFDRLVAALSTLAVLRQAQVEGGGLNERRVLRAAGLDPVAYGAVFQDLESHRYISRGEKGDLLLTRDLGRVTLYDLYGHLGLSIDAPLGGHHLGKAWGMRFHKLRGTISQLLAEHMSMPLEELLAPARPGEFDTPVIEDDLGEEDEEERAEEKSKNRSRILALLGLGTLTAGS